MKDITITDSVRYIGTDDHDIDLFESQYVVPNGVSYNSYLIIDEKIAIMDTVDSHKLNDWLDNLEKELNGRTPDYLVVSHMEPDHSAGIKAAAEKYPQMKLIGNSKTFTIMSQFFDMDINSRKFVVSDGDKLELGTHILNFIFAPMVHWPEVMMSYESSEKILFSADAFGKFGALDTDEDWACEARRYYFNIVGKYGVQVQSVLKKLSGTDVKIICPLHGPILKENLKYYTDLYNTWSSYEPEADGVFVAYASIHGNTAKAAKYFAELLKKKGASKVVIADISRSDIAECIEDAFKYGRVVLAASSYDGGVFAPMHDFLGHLAMKGYKNRKIGLIENGSWGPTAARTIKTMLDGMENITVCDTVVTIKSVMKETDKPALDKLADEILE
ncbi:MAG: FprA family A-type flavoprotein [Clostridia bacterium]|nr:FprA family A-type flavoprotein [Clostridia bacterium]